MKIRHKQSGIDYRALLKKYIAQVVAEEGTDFIREYAFTQEEYAALRELDAEMTRERQS